MSVSHESRNERAVLPAWAHASRVSDVSARGIASYVAALVRTGGIAQGEVLPPVRALAQEFRVSPATISTSWGLLKKRGLLVGTGKSGVRISGAHGLVHGLEMFATVPGVNDLRLLHPDLDLLPAIDQALIGAARQPNLNEYYDSAILPELQEAIAPSWPGPADAFAVANGGVDAVWSVLHANSVPGDRIIVESPTQPQLLSLMADLGLTVVPVGYDENGLDPVSFREALATWPVAVFFQPRAQVPTGGSMSRDRVATLAGILRGAQQPMIIEYDDLGELAREPHFSFSSYLPKQTVVIRSYEKSYGPDLRLAIIGASFSVIRNTHAQIRLTRQWTSRILQAALEWMIRDAETGVAIEAARNTYTARLDTLCSLLRERGIAVSSRDGFCAWVPVLDEVAAARELAALGILVLRGESCYAGPRRPHVRVATSRLSLEAMPQLADIIAATASSSA